MSNQLALTISLNSQKSLHDFCWAPNLALEKQIHSFFNEQTERFIYLWGATGCGKTHLLQGCCDTLNDLGGAAYLPLGLLKDCEPEILQGMENYTLLAIDDLESIAGNSEWEEALFHLYNRIRNNGKALLLMASKFSPAASPIQLPDLRSRLSWGIVYQLNELDDEKKIHVLQQQALKQGFFLPTSVALFLIKRHSRNMHALQNLLEILDKASLAAKRKITIPFVKDVLFASHPPTI